MRALRATLTFRHSSKTPLTMLEPESRKPPPRTIMHSEVLLLLLLLWIILYYSSCNITVILLLIPTSLLQKGLEGQPRSVGSKIVVESAINELSKLLTKLLLLLYSVVFIVPVLNVVDDNCCRKINATSKHKRTRERGVQYKSSINSINKPHKM